MKTLLKETTPQQAYQMFEMTFDKYQLPKMLDDAFIYFTNHSSSLGSKCLQEIADYTNQTQSEFFLDVLAICHLIKNPDVLLNLIFSYRKDKNFHSQQINRAKQQQREIIGSGFNNDLYLAYSETIKHHKRLYTQTRQNIYMVHSMLLLIHELNK